MKLRLFLAAALICFAASLGMSVEVPDGRMIATLTLINEDSIPHTITVDENNRVIRVFAGAGGAVNVIPGQDVAQRVRHGSWRVTGDTGREMQIRVSHGQDYHFRLVPYVHGDIRTLVGILDDGYASHKVPLADMREYRHLDGYQPSEYDPNFHDDYRGDDGYQYYRTDNQESLGHAIHEAFDSFPHNLSDQNTNQPYYAPQPSNPW